MPRRIHRRRFLESTGAVMASVYVAGRSSISLGASANDRINIACVGVGGKGRSDSTQAGEYGNVVAICDIDDEHLNAKAAEFPKAVKFNDYRKLLDKLHSQIDAVVVSTADHAHAAVSVAAMQLGKHVYCQKPLTHSVSEARLMRDVAREQNVITQMGNQGTAADGFRAGVEIIQSGAIGDVNEVHVWTNRPFRDWEQGIMYWQQAPDLTARPTETPPVPDHVHWDLFIGPAPERPYHPVYHPHDWRGWRDFGTGALGDMACHTANLPFKALKLGLPTRVSAVSSPVNSETYQAWATITYEFPARGDLPPVKLVWYEGSENGIRNLPEKKLLQGQRASQSGAILIGSKGTLFTPSDYGMEHTLLPANDFSDYRPPTPWLRRLGPNSDRDTNQKREWVEAIVHGGKTESDFEYASRLTEAMLLGNVAVQVGQPIEYDAENTRVTNCPAAAPLVRRDYRSGWNL
ncbi:MAG: dehydrogenase [Planctomycetaceae bacterium]|nr:dehydrogenase [Planctomycetaceae bacterium]